MNIEMTHVPVRSQMDLLAFILGRRYIPDMHHPHVPRIQELLEDMSMEEWREINNRIDSVEHFLKDVRKEIAEHR